MIFRATEKHLPQILEIYEAAREYMRTHGNPTQWGDNYPNKALILADIQNGNLHIITADDGHICACFGLFWGEDPTYMKIDGNWKDNTPYAAVHRVASDGTRRGVFREIFKYVSEKYSHLRIDTHENNLTMQKAILSCGFVHCGTIYVADGTPRLAYEWSSEK